MSTTAKVPTGYDLNIDQDQPISDESIKQQLQAQYKQDAVKKNNFPTEIIQLPSKGLVYPLDHPLASGTIEMRYMTAKDEDILTSQNLIKQGVVLDKLFESLIVTPVNYNSLYVGDKNAIMVAARILGYGKEYIVETDDPFSPGKKQKVTIDLTQIEHKEVDFTLLESRTAELDYTLPQSKRVVTFRLLTHGIEQDIKAELKTKLKETARTNVDSELSTRLKNIIVAVDGISGRATVNNFVDNELFAQDSRSLRQYIKSISPDLDMTFTFESSNTGEVKEIDIPMDVSFFWPGG